MGERLRESLVGEAKAWGLEESPMPHLIFPMRPGKSLHEPSVDPDWIFEPKIDGWRVVFEVKRGEILLYTRHQVVLNPRFQSLAEALGQIGHDFLGDGELVLFDSETGRFLQSSVLQGYTEEKPVKSTRSRVIPIIYFIDLLHIDGYDISGLPWERRAHLRRELFQQIDKDSPIKFMEPFEDGVALFHAIKERQAQGHKEAEGVMAKRRNSPHLVGLYRARTSNLWIKIRTPASLEEQRRRIYRPR